MIPQKLQIKNFLSYGPQLQTIDFTNYSLICLSGKNGHGKSALLDAITWALWGQARKIGGAAKADQGLLRLGQTQMLVIFDFIFGGKSYRIRREYMETYGKPVAVLEFGIVEPQSNTFIPLTDKTIRTTQEKIEQTLRLDFESFSNSAFLRQGSSNEFSKKSPKERKHILASILGLDQYEIIRKLALEKAKDAISKKAVLTALQEKRIQELSLQESLDKELGILNAQTNQLLEQEKNWQKQNKFLLHEYDLYNEKQKQYHNFSFQIEQLTQTLTTKKAQLQEVFYQWRAVNRNKKLLHSTQQLEQEKNSIVAAIIEHQKKFQESLEHRQTLLQITHQLSTIEQKYAAEHTQKITTLQIELERLLSAHKSTQHTNGETQKKINELQKESDHIAATLESYHKDVQKMSSSTTAISTKEARLEKQKAQYQNFVSLGNWLTNQLQSLTNKKKLVHGDDPSCPLCEQNLSASRRRFLKANFEKEESFIAHRLQRLKRIIPVIKEKLIKDHTQITQEKEAVQHAIALETKIAELHTQQKTITQEITQHKNTLEELQTTLVTQAEIIALKELTITQQKKNSTFIDENYIELQNRKKVCEKQLEDSSFNENQYKKDQETLAHIESQLQRFESLQKESSQQENRKNTIKNLIISLKDLKNEVTTIQQKRTELGDLEKEQNILSHKKDTLETEQTVLKKNKEELLHAKGRIENQQQHLSKIKEEFDQEESNIAQLENTIQDYQTIATATGKDGIQALLIEEAIPEIEQEANYLLSRLTNNQAHIFIESLRDLKKGGTKETLDIKISDQAGIRPYELFSGGEAFRIDFALRIAISKLLARRSGTALQTLIIDEGFGSQDDEGLSNIMDALYKIQDDFSKIIIVSHLPVMKDQFPVHFFIEKGVQGSVVKVIEQG